MNKELIIRSSSNIVDFALLKDGKLVEMIEIPNHNWFLAWRLLESSRPFYSWIECCICKCRL